MTMRLILILGLITACVVRAADDGTMDRELTNFANSLAKAVSEAGLKKVAALDFTDLQGNPSELGRFIAEQVTVNLVLEKRDFGVVDRANLKRILDEHKLSMSGLIVPENTKKLGQFSGVDAIILGRIAPMSDSIVVSATVVSAETAEIAGGAKVRIPNTTDMQQMLGKPTGSSSAPTNSATTNASNISEKPLPPPTPKKDFTARQSKFTLNGCTVEIDSFRILQGGKLLVTMVMENTNTFGALEVAVDEDYSDGLREAIVDENGAVYSGARWNVSGIAVHNSEYVKKHGWGNDQPTELPSGENIKFTMAFNPEGRSSPTSGLSFKFRVGFIVAQKGRTPISRKLYFEEIKSTRN